MSRQYRVWADHLTRTLHECMPLDESYVLLHTANMVGLFTCVFVKHKERHNIKSINASEIKRGMGGLHGNKVCGSYLCPMELASNRSSPGCSGLPLRSRRQLDVLCQLPSCSRPNTDRSPQQRHCCDPRSRSISPREPPHRTDRPIRQWGRRIHDHGPRDLYPERRPELPH